MFKNTIWVTTLLAVAAPLALAQEPEMDGKPATPATPAAPAAPGDLWKAGTLGVSIPFFTLSGLSLVPGVDAAPQTIDVLYFLSGNAALDLIAGINLHKTQTVNTTVMPPTVGDKTTFGFVVGAGYRMYKHKGAMHAYIEPKLALIWPDASNGDFFSIALGGDFGLERTIVDWFSISGAVGGVASYGPKPAGGTSGDIRVTTTAALAANFYWR